MVQTSRYNHLRLASPAMVLFLLAWCCSPPEGAARAIAAQPRRDMCPVDNEVMNLCQRCAKATKSPSAFPLCCGDEEGAQDFCRDYIYFGLQERPPDF